MTRRLKPQPETEIKMTREAQLAASRAVSSRGGEADAQPPEIAAGDNTKTPPVKPRTILTQQSDPAVIKHTSAQTVPVFTTPEVDLAPREVGTHKEIKPSSSESDYISLSDLQASLFQSHVTAKPEVDKLTNKPEVVSMPEIDDSRTVSAKMFNDGENSFLQLTFTVKLDKNSVSDDRQGQGQGQGQGQVVSGTVNIVNAPQQPTTSHVTVTPVVIGQQKPETRASSAGAKSTKKPVGVAGIQLTHDDNRRKVKPETESRQSSAGTQRSTRDHSQVCKPFPFCLMI